jgi:hypothetical protein
VIKHKGVKQTGVKQELGVLTVSVDSLLVKFCPTSTDFLAALVLNTEDYNAIFDLGDLDAYKQNCQPAAAKQKQNTTRC